MTRSKSKFAAATVALAFTLLVGCTTSSSAPPSTSGSPMHLGPAITFDAPSAPSISPVEIADTPADRAQGLMGRSVLAPDGGMLFVFDAPTTTTFWMKDTTIPLTIAFIGPDRRIVNIQDMPPCKTTTCPTYAPKTAYTWAIEVNRGWFGDHEVKVGDRIVSPLP